MKYCPTCQSQYTDDTLRFCLQDGAPLENVPHPSPPTGSYGEQETVVSSRPSSPISPPRETQPIRLPDERAPKRSNTATAVFVTVFAMLLFFSLVGIGLWTYLNGLSSDKNANLIRANKADDDDNSLKAGSTPRTETAKTTPLTATPPLVSTSANTNSTPPQIDREQIKKDVSNHIEGWKSQAESLDLNAYMSHYAETIDYYNKRGASLASVRSDKQKAFSKYDSMKINLSNLSVTPAPDGERATAVFDKEWNFSSADDYSAGKVRTQLQLKKVGGRWLITGERDLKVYYVE